MADPKRDVEMTEEELAKAAGGRRGRTEGREAERDIAGAGRPDELTDEQLKQAAGGRRQRTRPEDEDDRGTTGLGRGQTGTSGPAS